MEWPFAESNNCQVGMNGDTFSIKAPKECSQKFAANFKEKSLTRGNVLTIVFFPGEKRHININFLLWLRSRWPWNKRLVVPGLTGPKSLCVRLEIQEI